MNLLAAVTYDPAAAVSKATSSLLAMTAFDTTNLRLAITVPAHGKVRFRLRCTCTGATTIPTVLLGVLNGATVVGRVAPSAFPGTMNATTNQTTFDAEFTATGLAAGAMNVDAAYAVQVVVASTNIKYGGPNNNSGANAWGGFVFEAWDPQPMPTNFSSLSVDANGRVDVIKLAGTTQTARDIGASVLLSSGAGAGQLDFTSGVVKSNAVQLLGTAWLTPGVAGTPDVNAVKVGGTTQTAGDIPAKTNSLTFTGAGKVDASVRDWVGDTIPARSVTGVPKVDPSTWDGTDITTGVPLAPTVAGRTLDVSATGEAGLDWANIGAPTTAVALTGTTIAATQKVDVDTIKTNPVVNAGTVTFPTGATLASTTNITGGTITTVTTVTNQLTAAQIATGVWQDATAGDFTVASSIGKALYIANIAPGASGGYIINGANAGTVTLGALTITGNFLMSDGMTIAAPSTLNRAGITVTGNGTGAGISSTGGATGHGFSSIGGGTSGDGGNFSGGSAGHGLTAAGVGTTKHGVNATGGATASDGIRATAGGAGHGLNLAATTGDALRAFTNSGYAANLAALTGGNGMKIVGGTGSGTGLDVVAGTTGVGFRVNGGATRGDAVEFIANGNLTSTGLYIQGGTGTGHGVDIETFGTGDGVNVTVPNGNALKLTAGGTDKHGIVATGGTGGTSDGIKAVAGTGGVDIRGNITGNVTGNLSGSVGSLTTNNDKTGYALSSAGVQAVWDALTSALTTVGSVGKKLADWVQSI